MAEHRMSIEDIWKESGFDIVVPASQEIADRQARFAAAANRSNLREYLAAVVLFGLCLFFALHARSGLVLAGWVMTMAATIFIATTLHLRSKGDGPVFGADTTAHYLADLIRRRDLLLSIGKWYILPLVPGFVLLRAGMHLAAAPEQQLFHVLYDMAAVSLAVGLIWWNRRHARELNAEIQSIRALTRA